MSGSSVVYNYSSAGYDEVGRPLGYVECPADSDCTTGAATVLGANYVYDLAGNPLQVNSQSTMPSNGATIGGIDQRNYAYDLAGHVKTVTADARLVGAQDAGAVTLLTTPTYNAAGKLTAASLAVSPSTQQSMIALTRTYDLSLRPLTETDTGQVGTPGTDASTTVSVTGTEKSAAGSGTPAVATGTISLSYNNGNVMRDDSDLIRVQPLYASNSITLPNGYHVSFIATANSAVTVANAIASVLNTGASPVTAVVAAGGSATAASVTLTTKATGTAQNGAITLSLLTTKVTAAAASLHGGAGNAYDVGSVTANVNGTAVSASYGQASTPTSIAGALATAINGVSSLGVTAISGSGGALTITAKQPGTAGNGVQVNLSSTTGDPGLFSSPSFTGTSGTLSGGTNGTLSPGTVYSYSIPSPPSATTGYAGNGNVLSFTDLINSQSTARTATYDTLSRLLSFASTPSGGSSTTLAWSYDVFGNRKSQTGEAQVSYPSGNNRASSSSGYTYDAAGNVTQDPSNEYGYDGEGRLCTVYNKTLASYTGYAYDGMGNRVARGTGPTSLSCDNTLTLTNSFVVGPNGEQLDELSTTGAVYSNVYANGELLATYQFPASNWTFALNDWLGTKRVVANATGAQEEYCVGQPFGDGLNCTGNGDPSSQHFTGKERDAESGLDYFGARYFGSSMGRFMSPDTYGGRLADPQSLNKYAYARNNPLIYVDPDGHDFNLTGCGTTNTATCQNNMVGTTSTDANGKSTFTATVISNGANGLQDQAGNSYSGTVTSAGVSFQQSGSNTSYGGSWINGSNDTSFSQTGGALNGFSFTFSQPNTATGQTLAGTFSYGDNMSASQAGKALEAAGFSHSYFDAIANPLHGYDVTHYRGGGDPNTGAGAAHFILDDPYKVDDGFVMGPVRAGDFHFGETDPRVAPVQHIMHDVIPSFFTPH